MQQIATSTFQHGIHERGPFVIPVRAVERVRIRTRLRRARTDFVAALLRRRRRRGRRSASS